MLNKISCNIKLVMYSELRTVPVCVKCMYACAHVRSLAICFSVCLMVVGVFNF